MDSGEGARWRWAGSFCRALAARGLAGAFACLIPQSLPFLSRPWLSGPINATGAGNTGSARRRGELAGRRVGLGFLCCGALSRRGASVQLPTSSPSVRAGAWPGPLLM